MSDSIWADVLDELYDATVTEAFLAAEIAAQRLYVFDGPIITTFDGATIMTIGSLPIAEQDAPVESEWDWATMGRDGANADVDDAFSVPVGIHTLSGDSDFRVARRTAITVYTKFAAMVRNTTLGLPGVMWCIPQMASLTMSPTADGAECLITCAVHVRTRV